MKQSTNQLCLLGTALILCVSGFTHASQRVDPTEISQLFSARAHHKVIEKLKDMTWTLSSDPGLLSALCYSQLEVDRSLSPCIKKGLISPQLTLFVDGLTNLWTGKTKIALAKLSELSRDPKAKWWAYHGYFEFATYTGNYTDLGIHLDRFGRESKDAPASVLKLAEAYQVYFFQETCNLDGLSTFLSKRARSAIIQDPGLLAAKLYLMYERAEIKQIPALINETGPRLRESEHFRRFYAKYLQLTEGEDAADKFYRTSLSQNSSQLMLQLDYAYFLLADKDKRKDGLVALEKVLAVRGNDLSLLLGLTLTLTSYRETDEARRIFKRHYSGDSSLLNDFSDYYTQLAWELVYSQELNQAKSALKVALTRSPCDPSANWLSFLIAKKEKDIKTAFRALSNLFKYNPYNESAVVSILELSANRGSSKEFEGLVSEIKKRRNWYSAEVQSKMKELKLFGDVPPNP